MSIIFPIYIYISRGIEIEGNRGVKIKPESGGLRRPRGGLLTFRRHIPTIPKLNFPKKQTEGSDSNTVGNDYEGESEVLGKLLGIAPFFLLFL